MNAFLRYLYPKYIFRFKICCNFETLKNNGILILEKSKNNIIINKFQTFVTYLSTNYYKLFYA